MKDDIAKAFFRFLEKYADDFVRGMSRLWENGLARVASINFFRFLFKEPSNGKETLEGWVILLGIATVLILIIISLFFVFMRERNSSQHQSTLDGS